MPKVSIILTSYNQAQFIGEAIQSVLNQTEKDFELIIWDDASTDNSWEIITQFDDKRIKAFRNSRQMRGVWGINQAIFNVVSAPFIAIHHSDDVWLPNKLEKQIYYYKQSPDIGALFSYVTVIDERGESLPEGTSIFQKIFCQKNRSRFEWIYFFLTQGNCLCHPTAMVPTGIYKRIGGYPYGLGQLGDLYTWTKIAFTHKIHILEEELVLYRKLNNDANTSAPTGKNNIRLKNEFYFFMELFSKCDDIHLLKYLNSKFYQKENKFKATNEYEDVTMNKFIFYKTLIENNFLNVSSLCGVNMIFNLLQNPSSAKILYERCNFSYIDFINLTGSRNFFCTEENTNKGYPSLIANFKKYILYIYNYFLK